MKIVTWSNVMLFEFDQVNAFSPFYSLVVHMLQIYFDIPLSNTRNNFKKHNLWSIDNKVNNTYKRHL